MKDKKTIFIDLDGTILDVSERNYRVYKDILQKYNKKFLSKKNFLKLKRNKISIKNLLRKTKAEEIFKKFEKEWFNLIEKSDYLNLDTIPQNRRSFLLTLKKKYSLILVTLRNDKKALINQLKNMKLINLFDKILVASGRKVRNKWKIKSKLIKSFDTYSKDSIIIGDTESDILAGKYLGFKTVAVFSGMRDKKILKKFKPDSLVRDISEINNL